jgi:hypothetical protein
MKEIENLDSLNEFLEKIQDEKDELKSKIETLESQIDYTNWEWIKSREIPSDDYRKDLPCPRLEMTIYGNRYKAVWLTGLVFPDYCSRGLLLSPLTMTTTTGDEILKSDSPHLPWKDEFHIYSYSRIFNLRMFLTRDSDKFIKELFVGDDFIPSLKGFEGKFVKK